MLLKTYKLEIFNSECMPGAMTVHCFAHLDQDISCALPYLNAVLGGFTYIQEPPSVTFKVHGKLITVHGRKIAINALKDETEAEKIIEWLKREINEAWNKREDIEPSYEGMPQPQVIEILKLLPKTNCKECGEPTCLVFATRIVEGSMDVEECRPIGEDEKAKLDKYLGQFNLEII